jgi:YHS domain-containing protein
MSQIDEFKSQLRAEVAAGREQVETMQTQAAEQYQRMQANYVKFLDVSQQIRDALRPWVEAFGETLPDVTPAVTQRDFGAAGRAFHGVFVTFTIPRGERCPANIKLRFGLEAGVDVDHLILFYDLDIVPVFVKFERHDQISLPLDASSVTAAVEWFKKTACAFTKTYVSMFFNAYYQKGTEVPDIVLGRTFPRAFAKGETKRGGVTYYFLTEESHKAFEQDPSRYIGSSPAP